MITESHKEAKNGGKAHILKLFGLSLHKGKGINCHLCFLSVSCQLKLVL